MTKIWKTGAQKGTAACVDWPDARHVDTIVNNSLCRSRRLGYRVVCLRGAMLGALPLLVMTMGTANAIDVSSVVTSNVSMQIQSALEKRLGEGHLGVETTKIGTWSTTRWEHGSETNGLPASDAFSETIGGDSKVAEQFYLGLSAGASYATYGHMVSPQGVDLTADGHNEQVTPYAYYMLNDGLAVYGYAGYADGAVKVNARYSGVALDINGDVRDWLGGVGIMNVRRWGDVSVVGSLEYELDAASLKAAAASATNGGTTLATSGIDQSGTRHTGTLQLRTGYDIDAFTPYLKGKLGGTTTDVPGEKGHGQGEMAVGVEYRIASNFSGSIEGFKGFVGGNNPQTSGAELNLRLRF